MAKSPHFEPTCSVTFDGSAYVLHIDTPRKSSSCDSIVAAGSNGIVRIYSRRDLKAKETLKGHEKPVTGVRFHPENPQLVFSSSMDGCIQCHDLRTGAVGRVYSLRYRPPGDRCFCSFDLDCTGKVLVAGTDARDGDSSVLIWDARQSSPLDGFEEIHSDDVTQVKFHPTRKDQLLTGSTDGLVCVLDLSEPDKENALISVLNSESSVNRVGFFGLDWDCVYCLTHVESFYTWHAYEADQLSRFPEFRKEVESPRSEAIDYLVDCAFDSRYGNLILLAGSNRGSACLIDAEGQRVAAPVAKLRDGHSGVIRCLAMADGRFEPFYTGGEDGRICVWKMDK